MGNNVRNMFNSGDWSDAGQALQPQPERQVSSGDPLIGEVALRMGELPEAVGLVVQATAGTAWDLLDGPDKQWMNESNPASAVRQLPYLEGLADVA